MTEEVRKIKTIDNLEINCHIRETGSKTWIILTHGVGEYAQRHNYLFKLLSQYFNICLYDLRGHGQSEGKRGHVNDFGDYCLDLDSVISYLRAKYSMQEYCLMGHSMGALITASFIQNHLANKQWPKKVFLSAPPVSASGFLGSMLHYAPVGLSKSLAELNLSVPIKGLIPMKYLSHDKRVIQDYMSDPQVQLSLHSRLLLQLVAHARNVFSRPLRCEGELFVAFGSDDKVINTQTLKRYFGEIEKKANVLEVDGGYHELHNEIDKYRKPYFQFLQESFLSRDQVL